MLFQVPPKRMNTGWCMESWKTYRLRLRASRVLRRQFSSSSFALYRSRHALSIVFCVFCGPEHAPPRSKSAIWYEASTGRAQHREPQYSERRSCSYGPTPTMADHLDMQRSRTHSPYAGCPQSRFSRRCSDWSAFVCMPQNLCERSLSWINRQISSCGP
jgi:hypothetical protein